MRDQWYDRVGPKYLAYLGSKEWKALRAQVIERCNNTCERCGKFSVDEVHHMSYARKYREELADLQGVCEYCHDFLHGKSPNDGTVEHARQVREREVLAADVKVAQRELRRFDNKPELYRSFAEAPLPDYRELMRLLKDHPRVIGSRGQQRISNVRYAKRKYESAVAFRVEQDTAKGYVRWSVPNAGEWLLRGVIFDRKRRLWVDIYNIRWLVQRYSSV